MNSPGRTQDAVLTDRLSEPMFVALAYLFAQFSVLSMSEYFPGKYPILVASIASTFGASIAATIAGLWVDRSNGNGYVGRTSLSARQFAACACGGAGYAVVVHLLVLAFPSTDPANPMLAKAFLDKGLGILALWMMSILIVAPIGEEMVFRGAIQGYLSARIGSGVAIVISAFLFALIHVLQLNGYWPAIFAIFGLGIAAGIARKATGSLLGAVLVHVAYNSMTMASVLAGRS